LAEHFYKSPHDAAAYSAVNSGRASRRRSRGVELMAVQAIPDGHHTVTPYLVVHGAADFIKYVKEAFGATERMRIPNADGKIMHAELQLGDSRIMLGDASDASRAWPAMLHLYVPDVDAMYKNAMNAGSEAVREPADQPDGDRRGGVKDRGGNEWWLATHVKDVVLA
jgi:uncharacterized glyoxalase superfamily protein PhnB